MNERPCAPLPSGSGVSGCKTFSTMQSTTSPLFTRAVDMLDAIPHLSFAGLLGTGHFCYGYDGEVYPVPFNELPGFVADLEATMRDCGL